MASVDRPQEASSADVTPLRELNENIAQWEQRRDEASIEALDQVLSAALIFRRADASIAGKEEFMRKLRERSPFASRRSDVLSTEVLGSRALVTVDVSVTGHGGETARYRNIRFFSRDAGRWQLDSWFNEKIADA